MVIFGIMMTALSSFGQTFLLALYVPFVMEEFTLSNGLISTFYGVATIVSATLLPKVGKLIDTIPLKTFTLATTGLFIISLLFFSFAQSWWYIPVAFLGLRLAGQGLYSHIAITSMSRYFDVNRGKAISLASLGHPLGQAVLPALILILIGVVGWRESLWINAALVSVLVILFTVFVLKVEYLKPETEDKSDTSVKENKVDKIRQRDIMKSKAFWLLAPNIFFIPFAITGLFFYQFAIVEFKGWNQGIIAGGLTAFAMASAFSILTAGPLIDKYRARAFFPFYLIPYFISLMVIWLVPNVWAMYVYMVFMGLSVGFGSATVAALQVEFFGQKYIGTVRSLFTSIMVLSSAVGPTLFGVILDAGLGFETVFPVTLGILALIIFLSIRSIPKYSVAKWKFKMKRFRGKTQG